MITFFNRRELLVLQNPHDLTRVEAILKAHNIEFITRQEDISGGKSLAAGRARGVPGVAAQWVYRIYVKKDAYDYASYLIRNESENRSIL